MSRSTWRVYSKWSVTKTYRDQAIMENQEALARIDKDKSDLVRLMSQQGWEEEVRKNYQLAKPGEGVLIFTGTTTR